MADGRPTLVAAVTMGPRIAGDEALSSELKDYVKTTLLPYKYPRQFLYLDTLPKTGTDKIDRQACKRLFNEMDA